MCFAVFLSSCTGNLGQDEKEINKKDELEENIVATPKIETSQTSEAIKVFGYPQNTDEINNQEQYRQIFENFTVKNIDARKACEIFAKIFPEASFTEGARSNQIIVKAMPVDIVRIRKLFSSIDVPVHQVIIESQILELTKSDFENFGFSWSISRNGMKMAVENSAIQSDKIYATINALKSNGKARLIANPSIATIDNQEASVNIGSKIPFAVPVNSTSQGVQWTIQYIDAGVSLKITPKLADNDYIIVSVNPEVSSISEWRTTAAGEFPVISTRNASTKIRIKNGQTIVIAGLINETDRKNMSKIPIAGDMPILGALFSQQTLEEGNSEIVFLIRPRII